MKTIKFLAVSLIGMVIAIVTGSVVSAGILETVHFMGGAQFVVASAPLAIYERKVFELMKKKYGESVNPSPSFLRIEAALSNSTNRLSFDIKKNGNENAVEQKLDRNDLFVTTRLGIYLLKQDDDEIGNGVLQTYPNSQHFGSASGFTVADLETIYHGHLWMKIGQTVNIENMPLINFRHVPTTLKSASLAESEFNAMEMSYTLPTLLYLHGTDNVEIKVEFPTWSGIQIAATATGYTNKIVLMPFGFLLKNSARGLR